MRMKIATASIALLTMPMGSFASWNEVIKIDTYNADDQTEAAMDQIEPANARHPVNVISDRVTEITFERAASLPKTHAGAKMMEKSILEEEVAPDGFYNPWIGLDYGFSYSEDQRELGYTSYLHMATLSGGFTTYFNIDVGAMFMYTGTEGDDIGGDAFSGSIWASRPIFDWLYFGVSGIYTSGDQDTFQRNVWTSTDSDTWAVSPFLMFIHSFGPWTLSCSPTYVASFQDTDIEQDFARDSFDQDGIYFAPDSASGQNSTTHKLVIANRIGYKFTDSFSATVNISPNIVLGYDGPDQEDFWLNTGIKFKYKATNMIDLFAKYSYDLLHSDYENHNVNVGLDINF